jgi:hypothetical protein
VPLVLYGDRSGILIRNDPHWTLEEELAGRQGPTQFGRMLEELGVSFIAATSPQAKGRIERLWATLQDRLAAELRLLGHSTLEAALAYLPRFIAVHNRRLARPAAETTSAFRTAPRDLDRILACVYQRVVARDNTVTIPGRWAQVPAGPHQRSYNKARVEVRELLEGRLLVLHPRHGLIAEQASPSGAFILESRGSERSRKIPVLQPGRPRAKPVARKRKTGIGTYTNCRTPKQGHPWKRPYKPSPQPERSAP